MKGGPVEDDSRDRPGRPGGMPETPRCPFCAGRRTELLNAFGPHASLATYWCRSCRSPFELMKWSAGGGPAGDREG